MASINSVIEQSSNIKIVPESGCWVWQKSKAGMGYGVISFFKRNYYVHRAMYRIFYGEISRHNVVMHSCDNPSCINPLHLSQGSMKENVEDMWRKGRSVVNTDFFDGPNNPKLKFTEEQINSIRKDKAAGVTINKICKKYGVSKSYLWKICSRKTRSNI